MGATHVGDKVAPPFSPVAVASGSAQDWLPLSKLRVNLSKSQDDAMAWGLLGFVITSHPYGHGLSGLRPPGSFEGSGTNGLSLCTDPHPQAPQGNHLPASTPTVQSPAAQHQNL